MNTMQQVLEQASSPEVTSLVERASEWFASPKGRQELIDTVRQTVETASRLRRVQQVDPKTLLEPVTV